VPVKVVSERLGHSSVSFTTSRSPGRRQSGLALSSSGDGRVVDTFRLVARPYEFMPDRW
jgi:hypothetical protein